MTQPPPGPPPPGWTPPQPHVVVVQAPAGRRAISGAEHLGHLALTVCTCGLWTPVWIVRALAGR